MSADQLLRECREMQAGFSEQESRIEAERCTLEFATRSTIRLDAGKSPIEESPLFGGKKQGNLF